MQADKYDRYLANVRRQTRVVVLGKTPSVRTEVAPDVNTWGVVPACADCVQ